MLMFKCDKCWIISPREAFLPPAMDISCSPTLFSGRTNSLFFIFRWSDKTKVVTLVYTITSWSHTPCHSKCHLHHSYPPLLFNVFAILFFTAPHSACTDTSLSGLGGVCTSVKCAVKAYCPPAARAIEAIMRGQVQVIRMDKFLNVGLARSNGAIA